MNEPFDKTLRNHIRDTFDHFDDGMADDGWKKFNAQKNKKRRALVFWYALPSGIAAALALVWLLNLNYTDTDLPQNNQFAVKQNVAPLNSDDPISKNSTDKKEQPSNPKTTEKLVLNVATQRVAIAQTKKSYTHLEIVSSNKSKFVNGENTKLITNINTNKTENPINQNIETPSNTLMVETLAQNITPNSLDIKTVVSSDQTESAKPELSIEEKSILLANALKAIPENNLNPTSKVIANNNKKFNISIDANSFYSFTNEGINDQLNLGLGLATEFKIAKNLSLNSGISINRQTTSFAGNEKTVASLLSTKSDGSLSSPGTGGASFASVTNPEYSDAKLTGLDIPLNLKLDVKIGQARTFITTGISSYSIINEKYVNDFTVTNFTFNGAETKNVSNKVENPSGKFSSFEFARTLNFSFGVVYPINQKHAISLEPFLKYPLSGFGYQDLKIGSGGLSFKLNLGK